MAKANASGIRYLNYAIALGQLGKLISVASTGIFQWDTGPLPTHLYWHLVINSPPRGKAQSTVSS